MIAQLPINRQIDEENTAHRNIFHSALKNKIVTFAVEWVRLGSSMFLQRSQAQKGEYQGESRFTCAHTHKNTQRHKDTHIDIHIHIHTCRHTKTK